MSNLKQYLSSFNLSVDEIGAKERAASLAGRSIKTESKLWALKTAISMLDLTTLEGKDSEGKVYAMCQKAIHPKPGDQTIPHVAAVCVYPNMIKFAKEAVRKSGVKVASVATAFPSGQYPLKLKIEDVQRCIKDGADEIDMVISRGEFLSGDYEFVYNEIKQIKETCTESARIYSDKNKTNHEVHLKVILETGELETYDNVRKASIIGMMAGGDFIKTSTGKVQPAATLPVTLVMLEAIRDYYNETGIKTGMKPAGGIKTAKVAIAYLVLMKETLGDEWLTPDLYRLGASSVLNDILMQIDKQKTGYYQGADYYSLD
ncbi:MAG: Deoxyribose-phosphate aldolase [Ignavibacteria bacterium]|nr:Deoxyribose-phosphate aldolase [Ignavibacteria bacterium]